MTTPVLIRTVIVVLAATAWPNITSAQQQKKTAGPTDQAMLLGRFEDWKVYKAVPSGKQVCFAFSEPAKSISDPAGRKRDPSYVFVSTRPADKIKNEISVVVGYSQKSSQDAIAMIGSENFALYTENNGAWIKNLNEQPQMIEAMRKGADLVIKSESGRSTKTTDTYSLKGLAQALDKVAEQCR